MVKFKVVRLCKEDAMTVAPSEVIRYDLDKAAEILREKGYQVENKGPMVIAAKGEIEATIYTNGRLLVSKVKDKERAKEIADLIYVAVDGARVPFSPKRS